MIKKTLIGTIRGKTIELETNPGLVDGQSVEVTVRIWPREKAGEASDKGLSRCAGALVESWTENDDRILEGIHRERKSDNREEAEP